MSVTLASSRTALLTASFLAAFGAGMLSPPVNAETLTPESCKDVAGTYLTTVTDIEDVFMSRGLITFTSDGNFLVNDSGQGGLPGVFEPFSSGQGTWKCVEKLSDGLKVEAVALTFTMPSANRRPAIGRVDYTASVNPASNKITGKIALKFSSEGDLEMSDPVNAPGAVFEEFSFDGERVVLP